MSDLTHQKSDMPPQISPKDIPRDEDERDSDDSPLQDEPVFVELIDSSSEEDEHDEEEINAQGYVLLSQEVSEAPEGFLELQNEQQANNDNIQAPNISLTASGVNSEPAQASQTLDLNMQQDQVDLIRQVMSNITLPNSAIPDWAKVIPEEKWKSSLVSNIINNKQCQSPDSDPEK